MFRRLIRTGLALGSLALLFAMNLRVPFLKMYFRLCLAVCALLFAHKLQAQDFGGGGAAGCNTCTAPGCQRFHCPPVLKWCMEGMPRICFQHGCPKPICNPCEAPNWGYYQKCWSPWPWAPDWSHCPVPTPASQVIPGLMPAGMPVSRLETR